MPALPHSTHSSVQLITQDLLYQLAGIVPFIGHIRRGQLQIALTPSLRKLFALPPAPARLMGGLLLNRSVASADLPLIRAALMRLVEQGEQIDLRYRMQCADQSRCIRLLAQPQTPGSTRIVGVFKDSTVEVAAEQQWHASQERLQSLGRLTLLGEVASGLAHEINQPLAAITTFAQAGERLLQLPEPRIEKAVSVFKEISQQSLRAGDTLRHMRGLIKRRTTQAELVTGDVLIKDFLALAEPMARVNQVQLQVRLAPGDNTVSVDVAQIHQAMMILFQNAVEASKQQPGAQPQVCIELTAQPQGLELAVIDQGTGISASIDAQLFQPFFSTKEHGSGLGLVSCRNILEAHGSRLAYANLAEGGCRFSFMLPYAT